MKGLRLFFAVLLVPLAFQAAFADDEIDTSRAATRRGTTMTVSTNRQKTNTDTKQTPTQTTGVSRTTNISKKNTGNVRERQPVSQQSSSRSGNVVSDSSRTTSTSKTTKGISARTAPSVSVQGRTQSSPSRVTNRMQQSAAPTATSRYGGTSTNTSRIGRATTSKTIPANRIGGINAARSATTTATIESVTSRNYTACRKIFYECMDEFCANKDSILKRCACSSRINDFDKTKQQLSKVEDKLMDFSQRLLTVNMEKEDALALNQATEGETAYAQEDRSKSKKMLDDIAKKLNASFNDNQFDQNLNAISLSLNVDAAFDSVDSLMGASTTSKTGTDLYNAALPVCREMALEVCSQDDLAIAESGYQMSIAQDCNTVAKSYEAQNDQARAKILESGALLDMSRLDVHQKRNADDILTCKKKMLDMLTDRTVCGSDMSKCLDISGQYIDPTTGEAFLSNNLANLTKLISRPEPDKTWVKTPGNDKFVSFLNSKKVYLEPAMEGCQDISTYVWDAFVEDALAQIKLAQDAKLEEIRKSCTTLTTQCLDSATKTITDFDARALSVFGVKADVTINAMCSDIRETCTALIDATQSSTDNQWATGMTEIATTKTYETILSTCREVGKNCIIQTCSAISGNFGLCENIDTSINRKSVISRRACWKEVSNCIRDAGEENIKQIMAQYNRVPSNGDSYESTGDTYDALYGFGRDDVSVISTDENTTTPPYKSIYDWCFHDFKDQNPTELEWQICRLTEQIWGNCEDEPSEALKTSESTNRIIINQDKNNAETLLSWFARNTNTATKNDSCRDTTCGFGTKYYNGECRNLSEFTADGAYCPDNTNKRFTVTTGVQNCCPDQQFILKYTGNNNEGSYNKEVCCMNNTTTVTSYAATFASADTSATEPHTQNSDNKICATQETTDNAIAILNNGTETLYCVGGKFEFNMCSGYFMWINNTTYQYRYPNSNALSITNYYYVSDGTQINTLDEEEYEPSYGHSVDITSNSTSTQQDNPENP